LYFYSIQLPLNKKNNINKKISIKNKNNQHTISTPSPFSSSKMTKSTFSGDELYKTTRFVKLQP